MNHFKQVMLVLASILFTSCNSSNVEPTTIKASSVISKKPTNILWIFIEDQNAWNSVYGDNTVSTPNIAEFANSGVVFEKTMMPAAVCSATRSALITGAFQTTNGLHNHRSSRSNIAPIFLPKGYKTVPQLFSEAGFATFNIGKDDYNFNYIREQVYNAHPPVKGYQGAFVGGPFNWAKDLKDKPFFGQIQLKGGKHSRAVMDQLNVDTVNPELMADKLPPYYPNTAAYRREWANHYETQMASDAELKNIIDQLKDNGLFENTAVLFFSDHGMVLPRHKQFLYEEGVHVPFIVNWPGGNKTLRKMGARRKELISGLDIPSTSLALAGIDIPKRFDGINLFDANFKGREHVISAKDRMDYTFDRSRTVRTAQYRYIRNFNPERPYLQSGYRDEKDYMKQLREPVAGSLNSTQMLFARLVKPAEELYDLVNDPHQITNLVTNKQHVVELKRHRQILLDWMAKTDDKGAYPESDAAIKEVLMMWGNKCDALECARYKERYAESLAESAQNVHPIIGWPNYMPKPKDSVYETVEDVFNSKLQ
jgi:arylsulfatase A-like enzyme